MIKEIYELVKQSQNLEAHINHLYDLQEDTQAMGFTSNAYDLGRDIAEAETELLRMDSEIEMLRRTTKTK